MKKFIGKFLKNDYAPKIFLGIDIGATKTIFLVVKFRNRKFKVLEISKCPTPRKEKEILEMVEKNFKSLVERYKFAGIGIGFAGPVNFKKGEAIKGPNLKFTGKIKFKKILEKQLRIPVAVDNDVKCLLLAESAFGKAKGRKNVIALTLGTGTGGAIMIDGQIYRGADNFAGEVGHTYIGEDTEFEASASGTGLTKVYKNLTGANISSVEIVRLAGKNNQKALEAVERVTKTLGLGLASLIEVFNPELIILGGGLAEADLVVSKAKQYAKKKVFLASLAKTPISVSKLGEAAVAVGAALLFRNAKAKF